MQGRTLPRSLWTECSPACQHLDVELMACRAGEDMFLRLSAPKVQHSVTAAQGDVTEPQALGRWMDRVSSGGGGPRTRKQVLKEAQDHSGTSRPEPAVLERAPRKVILGRELANQANGELDLCIQA